MLCQSDIAAVVYSFLKSFHGVYFWRGRGAEARVRAPQPGTAQRDHARRFSAPFL